MKIAVIGTGNVGSALAQGFLKSGHEVRVGVRNPNKFKGAETLKDTRATIHTIPDAVRESEVIVIAAVPQAVREIATSLGDVTEKIIIDTMNSFRERPEGFSTTTEALTKLTGCRHVVKCFNSTGAENMANPVYDSTGIDMFYAGDSAKAKTVAAQLCKELGFAEVYDFGGSDKYSLLEQFAMAWVNLAIMQGHGRGMAFKVLKR